MIQPLLPSIISTDAPTLQSHKSQEPNREQTKQKMGRTGTGLHSAGKLLRMGENSLIYVRQLDPSTITDDVMAFLRENETGVKDCEELYSRGRKKAFKIRIPYQSCQIADDPSFWSEGAVFTPFGSAKSSDGSPSSTQATPRLTNRG
jgi:hypothetical protein